MIIYGTEIAYLFDNLEKFELVSDYSSLTTEKRNEKAAEANEKRLRIKVFNYRQELRDKSSLRRRWQSSIKISYCLSLERISK